MSIFFLLKLVFRGTSYGWLIMSVVHLTSYFASFPFFSFFFNFLIYFFNWRIIALQNFAVFCETSTWISHRFTYIPSHFLPHPSSLGWHRVSVWVSWAIEQITLGYLFTYGNVSFLFFFFNFLNFFPFIFISWRPITLQYCSGFCYTLTWISHGFTCVPHPDPPSHLPPHPIPLGLPSAPALSTGLMHPAWAVDLFHLW